MRACINTADDSSMADKNSVKFGTVTSEFCWLVCAQDERHASLCDAFRLNHIRQMAPTVDADAKRSACLTLVSLGAGRAHAGLCHASSCCNNVMVIVAHRCQLVVASTPSLSLSPLVYVIRSVWCGSSVVVLYTFIYNIHNVYTVSLFVHVRSLPSLVPILLFFPLHLHAWSSGQSTRRLLRLAVSPASLRGWRRRRLTPSPYISHYIYPTVMMIMMMTMMGDDYDYADVLPPQPPTNETKENN